jgi:hypothetical protein
VTQAGGCSGYVQKPATRRWLKIYVEEKRRMACSSTFGFTRDTPRYVQRQVSQKGSAKRCYNRLFLQV